MASVGITSSSIVRRHFYETFLKIHQALAVVIVTGIWFHVPRRLDAVPTLYLLVASSIWLAVRLLRLAQVLFRNLRKVRHVSRCTIWSLPDAFQVHVKVSRPWNFRAGQYVYLCIPNLSYTAWLQSHPYFISGWYRDENGDDIVVFIIERRKGLSSDLGHRSSGNLIRGRDSRDGSTKEHNLHWLLATDQTMTSDEPTELGALVEGPFGNTIPLDEYGTILLFATGIGIASQLPYIKQLLERFHDWDIKAGKIALFWEVSAESKCRESANDLF
jgi:predicted ferric reductase